MFIYIPENFHADKLTLPCHPDYARMFAHIILSTHYRMNCNEDDFVPLKALVLRKQIHSRHTETIKIILKNAGIIDCDEKYCPTLKCMGYRLTERYCHSLIKLIKPSTKALIKKLKPPKLTFSLPVHKTIWNWLNKIDVNYEAASQLLYDQENLGQKSLMLEKLKARDWFFHVDARGRVYHNVACLWSQFRKFLTIEGKGLVNIDIKNSQPLIFSSCYKNLS